MKKNNFKLKNEIIILPNADKDGGWNEKWTKDTHGYDVLVHPYKAILSGRSALEVEKQQSCIIFF